MFARPIVPLLAGLVVATTCAGTFAAVAAAGVPVALGGTSQRPNVGVLLEPPFAQEVAIIPARPGGEFEVAFNITNSGNRNVRITGIPDRFPTSSYVDQIGVRIGDGDPNETLRGGSHMGWVDFHPFDLPPGQFRMIQVRYRFENCRSFQPSGLREWEGTLGTRGGGVGWAHETLEYRYRGMSRSVDLELPYAVFLDGATGAC